MNAARDPRRRPAAEHPTAAGPAVSYADVFISHQRRDRAGAEALGHRIRALGHSCYLDAFDPALAGMQTDELAEHIRTQLRGARALLFYFTDSATTSKWMPWELGFFDGRWGKTTVGIYLVEPVGPVPAGRRRGRTGAAAPAATPPAQVGSPAAFSIQEYLQIYERVTDSNLADFLARAASIDTLANRSDVDIDRAMSMLTAALRNPLAFSLGWQKYLLGMWRPALQGQPLALAQLDQAIDELGWAREQAAALAPDGPPGIPGPVAAAGMALAGDTPWAGVQQAWLTMAQQMLGQGAAASGAPARGADPWAPMRADAMAAVQAAYDRARAAFQKAHEAGADASQ